MSLSIRLTRVGRHKGPFYRIVVADARSPRDGRFIEIIGHYQPLVSDDSALNIKEERALYWLHTGAHPSDTVRSLLRKKGVMKLWHEERLRRRKAQAGGDTSTEASEAEAGEAVADSSDDSSADSSADA